MTTSDSDSLYNYFMSGLTMPAFEGASQDYRNAQRVAFTADADLLALNELGLLQGRSRHVARNTPIISGIENKFVTKLGAVKIKWKTKEGKEHPLMQELWDEFYENPAADGKGDGNVMQAVFNHDRLQSGEALARMIIQTKDNDNRIKLKIQHIESEYLDINYRGYDYTDARIRDNTKYGITFGSGNKPLIYHFFAENYYGLQNLNEDTYKRVPVLATDVLHIFERLRSNQWRGIPAVTPMLSTLYELADLEFATVSKQQAAAAISWIVEQANQLTLNAPGSVNTVGTTHPDDETTRIVFRSNGGSVQYTNPGEVFHLVQSADIGNNLLGLLKHLLQELAVGYGMPYYMVSGDTSGLNFAGIRGILIEFRDKLEFIHHFVNLPDGLAKIAARFKAIAKLSYAVEDAYPNYMFPRYYGVDELKDTQGDILEVQAGFATSEQKREERGTTAEQVQQGSEQDKKLGREGLLDVSKSSSANLTNNSSTANFNSSSN